MKRIVYLARPLPRALNVGKNARIGYPRVIVNPERTRIGARTSIGNNVVLYALERQSDLLPGGELVIGKDCYIGHSTEIHCVQRMNIHDGAVISSNVYISDVAHGLNPSRGQIMLQPLESKGPVEIGECAFIGNGSIILPGVTIGRWAVVGANSVVTKPVLDFTMVAGNPATIVKIYDHNTKNWQALRG